MDSQIDMTENITFATVAGGKIAMENVCMKIHVYKTDQ